MEQFTHDVSTLLASSIDDSETLLTVSSDTGVPATGDFSIRIDNEIMKVTAVAGLDWTIERAAESVSGVQAASAHSAGATIILPFTARALSMVAIGFDANSNLFIGGGGTNVTSANANIGIGSNSLFGLTDGQGNLAIGQNALASCTTGSNNFALGTSSLANIITGFANVGIGIGAGQTLSDGTNNVFIGYNAGQNITVSSNNLCMGVDAGAFLVDGNDNVFLGKGTDTTKTDLVNGIAIGAAAVVKADNQCVIGGTDVSGVSIGFAGSTAPDDADIDNAGQSFFYWDLTPGSPALLIKGKDTDGEVFNQRLGFDENGNFFFGGGLAAGSFNLVIGNGGTGITTAGNNVVLGADAGIGLIDGFNNLFLGAQADTSKSDLNNGIALGSGAVVKADNQAVIGGTGVNAVCLGFAGTAEPADADIEPTQIFLYFDPTDAAGKLKIKAKTSDGTVVTGEVALA